MAILKVTLLKINRFLPIYVSIVPLKLIFKTKLKLKSGNQKIQYGCLAAILKLTLLKINRLLKIYISIVPLKFGVDIQSQTKVRVHLSLELIFKAKPKLESGNQKIQYGHQAAILKVTSLKIYGFCLWPPSTWIWSLKLKFRSKLDLDSGKQVTYRVH